LILLVRNIAVILFEARAKRACRLFLFGEIILIVFWYKFLNQRFIASTLACRKTLLGERILWRSIWLKYLNLAQRLAIVNRCPACLASVVVARAAKW